MSGNKQKDCLVRDPFYCTHLQYPDLGDISKFTCKMISGYGLVNYIRKIAWRDECYDAMRTYLVRDIVSHELVGYFSLKAGLVSSTEEIVEDSIAFDTLPGVELANFAVNYDYIKTRPSLEGVGLLIFNDFVLQIVKKASSKIGIQFLYIFALPEEKLLKRYEDYGFHRLNSENELAIHKRLKPRYDKNCIFMFQRFDTDAIEEY